MTITSPDKLLFLIINRHLANSIFDAVMPFLSSHGYLLASPFLVYLLIAAGHSRGNRGKNRFLMAILSICIACAAAYIADWADYHVKMAISRIRPCRALNEVRLLVPCPPSHSMPSGHAFTSFAFAVPLYYLSRAYLNPYVRLYPLFLASMIAFSRIYVGVHYPSDVLIGAILGACTGMLPVFLLRVTGKKMKLFDV